MGDEEGGFTLVEVLVALVMSSILVVIILDGAATARKRGHAAAIHEDAIRLGQAVLTRATALNKQPAQDHGREGGLEWTLTEQVIERDVRGYYALDDVRVDVSLPKGPIIQSFQTRKLRLVSQQ